MSGHRLGDETADALGGVDEVGVGQAGVARRCVVASVAEQTRASLAQISANLAGAGADRTRLLSATVYLTDIANKAEMDAVWCGWIGEAANWPQRACVQADLAPGTLVEITVVAARS